jgi:phage-related protein
MKVTKVGLLVFSLSLGSAAFAAKNPKPEITRQELQNFDNFLDSHPGIDAELAKDPKLIERPEYVSSHEELKTFLAGHPGVREEMKETPRFFMHREGQFDKSGRDVSRREAASLDVFLDVHPRVSKGLRKDPSLAKNPEFLSKHPQFVEFLGNHPAVKADLAENPYAFMKRKAEFEKKERREEALEASRQQQREEKREARSASALASPRASKFQN